MSLEPLDVVIVGSGVAGLSAAVRLGHAGRSVGVLTKDRLATTTTAWAQGGVAAAVDQRRDSTALHVSDTLRAGAGLCDPEAVDVLVREGPAAIEALIDLGASFDRDGSGSLALAREGGHTTARVLHAGGAATGAEVQRALQAVAFETATLLAERCQAVDLLVGDDGVEGVRLLGSDGPGEVRARHVVLATGGAGQLFSVTTNPVQATGDGIAMALRASVPVADVEFVQFHPTALFTDLSPRPLLSEALRGEGAILRDPSGERFVDELQPRDVVARAIVEAAARGGADHVWLDVTGLEDFAGRFPTLAASLGAIGLDPAVDWLPVAPAAHHLAGGVLTDLWGATALEGLWAIGETADTGVHGANRLASNSLLEGLVFGTRMAEAILGGARAPVASGALAPLLAPTPGALGVTLLVEGHSRAVAMREDRGVDLAASRASLGLLMTAGAGVVRDAEGLSTALDALASLEIPGRPTTPAGVELANLAVVAEAVLRSASARLESRGGHYRTDHPRTEPAFEQRLVHGRVGR